MKKLLRLDSIDAGGRAKQEVHDILASRCIVSPHPDLPAAQAEELATQVSLSQGNSVLSSLSPAPPPPAPQGLKMTAWAEVLLLRCIPAVAHQDPSCPASSCQQTHLPPDVQYPGLLLSPLC